MNIFRWLKTPAFFEALALVGMIMVTLLRRKPAIRAMPNAFLRRFLPVLRRPWIAFLLVGVLAFAGSASLTAYTGIPQPRIHDEFSYLLAADTFAHGRLTNPPHPLWKHFETFYEIQHPTYASKYPPGQGLMLALGQVVFGQPIVGVWLSVALACAVICWMLAGWCPLRWALVGGLVAVVRLVFGGPVSPALSIFPGPEFANTFAYWSQSYWGGAVAALGGALVFGALPRIMKKPRCRDAIWLALGSAILANSRPFEGLVVSIPVAVILGIWIIRTRSVSWHIRFYRLVLPASLILLLAALWMGFYNYRVAGYPFRMPYQIHESTYAVASNFLWQPLKAEPQYNHQDLRDFYRGMTKTYLKERTFRGFIYAAILKIAKFWLFFFGIIFTPFMLFLLFSRKAWGRRNVVFPLGICLLMLVALLVDPWFFPHYAAPVACLTFLLCVESIGQARRITWRGKPIGRHLVNGVLPMLLVSAIAFAIAQHLQKPSAFSAYWQDRESILQKLEKSKERALVIVRYAPNHLEGTDWIYNRADIDSAKMVWARDMGTQANKKLLDYFKDRRVWLLRRTRYRGT